MTATVPTLEPIPLPLGELAEAGFVPAAPDPRTAAIDRRALWSMRCEACGYRGLDYAPFVVRPYRFTDLCSAYRPFMVCPRCHHASEF